MIKEENSLFTLSNYLCFIFNVVVTLVAVELIYASHLTFLKVLMMKKKQKHAVTVALCASLYVYINI